MVGGADLFWFGFGFGSDGPQDREGPFGVRLVWKWIAVVFLVVVGLLGFVGYRAQKSGKFQEMMEQFNPGLKEQPVRLGTVLRGDLLKTVSAPGQVEPRTNIEISAQVSARILELPFEENAAVKKGDILVKLEDRDLAALLESAKAQLRGEEARLEGTRAQLASAKSELLRRRQLAETRDATPSELEAAETSVMQAESNLQQVLHSIEGAKANILRAEKDLENTIIRSPIDGVITRRDAEIGETVVVGTLNNPGSVIMEVADLATMWVKARVDEANIAPVKEGQPSKVYINAYPDMTFEGTVDHVSLKRMIDTDGTAYFETKVLLKLPKGLVLRSGLTANADIQVDVYRDVLKVPSQAVQDRAVDDLPREVTDKNTVVDPAKKFVRVIFVAEELSDSERGQVVTVEGKEPPVRKKVRAVPVTTGASDLVDTIILTGLPLDAKDWQIVTGPYKSLSAMKHGQKITVDTGKKAEVKKDGEPKGESASAEK